MKRRTLLKSGTAMLGFAALGGYTFLKNTGLCYASPTEGFNGALPIPPLLDNNVSSDGKRSFSFSVETGEKTPARSLLLLLVVLYVNFYSWSVPACSPDCSN